jgi:carbonic anhydrase/acetyltransferase-like protein (isoleucine patch superfamily)
VPDPPQPRLQGGAWAAGGSFLIGDVSIAELSSIWYTSVLRADGAPITIGDHSNIQDGCILHTDPDRPIHIGSRVSVGHRTVLHGCTIEDDVLIGMGAVVMNGAHIDAGSIVGAGALVLEDCRFPPHSLILGSPAKLIRGTTAEERRHIRKNASDYVQLMQEHSRRPPAATRVPTES